MQNRHDGDPREQPFDTIHGVSAFSIVDSAAPHDFVGRRSSVVGRKVAWDRLKTDQGKGDGWARGPYISEAGSPTRTVPVVRTTA